MSNFAQKTYTDRIQDGLKANATAKRLLELMDRKKTNLSVAADVTKKADLIRLAKLLGPHICVFKTHIDIVEDFDDDLITQLKALSEEHDFLFFEDRKFADIGNTVHLQYTCGVYKIASWSDITNAHPIPGDGIISGLAQSGVPLGRGLLLLAEMSSAGTLATGEYSVKTLEMAKRHPDFCIGFISQRRLTEDVDFIYMTPGVGLSVSGDSLGQQYRTPRQVILESNCDVIIVGRAIYGGNKTDEQVIEAANQFRKAGWDAYLERIKQ